MVVDEDVDAAAVPCPDDRFSAATVVLSLLHLPPVRAQDTALAEVARYWRRVRRSSASTPSTARTCAASTSSAGPA